MNAIEPRPTHYSTATLRCAALVCLALLVLMTGAAGAGSVTWNLTTGCSPFAGKVPPALETISCGSHGTYYAWIGAERLPLGKAAGGTCQVLSEGAEQVAVFPPPAAVPATQGWRPCEGGRCFSTKSAADVAVVDWDQRHGWTVGATILETSDTPIKAALYPLDDALTTIASQLPEIGDLHVLAQLCQIEDDYARNVARPKVINLSFGRLPGSGILSCVDDGTLSCQINDVLAHLAYTRNITIVAAAGNHGDELFPAQADSVLSVGTLDLEWFHHTGGTSATASWDSPSGTDILFPGYGICLSRYPRAPSYWRASPGSSYASAFFSGWIAGMLESGSLSTPINPEWLPQRLGGTYQVLDVEEGEYHPMVNGAEILERSQGGVCWPSSQILSTDSFELAEIDGPGPTILLPSLAERSATTNHPTPDSDPCLPCSGGWGPPPPAPFLAAALLPQTLVVDLGDGTGVEAPLEVVDVHVRIGTRIYEIEGPGASSLPEDLTEGAITQLVFANASTELLDGEQVSLVYTVRSTDSPGDFWTSSQILVFSNEPPS